MAASMFTDWTLQMKHPDNFNQQTESIHVKLKSIKNAII